MAGGMKASGLEYVLVDVDHDVGNRGKMSMPGLLALK